MTIRVHSAGATIARVHANRRLPVCHYYRMHLTLFYFTQQPSITHRMPSKYRTVSYLTDRSNGSAVLIFFSLIWDLVWYSEVREGKPINRFVDTAASRFRIPSTAPFSAVRSLHPHTPAFPAVSRENDLSFTPTIIILFLIRFPPEVLYRDEAFFSRYATSICSLTVCGWFSCVLFPLSLQTDASPCFATLPESGPSYHEKAPLAVALYVRTAVTRNNRWWPEMRVPDCLFLPQQGYPAPGRQGWGR
jgi:hypothetical protein